MQKKHCGISESRRKLEFCLGFLEVSGKSLEISWLLLAWCVALMDPHTHTLDKRASSGLTYSPQGIKLNKQKGHFLLFVVK